jgi:hypothetical protein
MRRLPAVQPAPLRQNTPLVAAELGSPILEPNLQENLLVTMTLTTVKQNLLWTLLFSANKTADKSGIHNFKASVVSNTYRRNTTREVTLKVKPDTFRSLLHCQGRHYNVTRRAAGEHGNHSASVRIYITELRMNIKMLKISLK